MGRRKDALYREERDRGTQNSGGGGGGDGGGGKMSGCARDGARPRDLAGPRGNAAVWWDPPVRWGGREGKRWERQGGTRCAACDSARNERIGQQHIA